MRPRAVLPLKFIVVVNHNNVLMEIVSLSFARGAILFCKEFFPFLLLPGFFSP